MPGKTIIAVAVGEVATADVTFNSAAEITAANVRPYLTGLQRWLASTGANRADPPQPANGPPQYLIGTHYGVIYRERPIANLQNAFQDQIALNADLWFCMSTSVARAADAVAKAQRLPSTKPIVAIVSDPRSETFGRNVCGASANRPNLATDCLQKFKNRIGPGARVFALHRANYEPSTKAKDRLGANVTPVTVNDGDNIQTIITNEIVNHSAPRKGVLVLPADRFFGVADSITRWTGNIPTFWSTPDFPSRASGGYGYAQNLCGQFMAERVAIIWKNQADGVQDPIPSPEWNPIPATRLTERWGSTRKVRAKRPTRKASAKHPARKASAKSSARKARKKR